MTGKAPFSPGEASIVESAGKILEKHGFSTEVIDAFLQEHASRMRALMIGDQRELTEEELQQAVRDCLGEEIIALGQGIVTKSVEKSRKPRIKKPSSSLQACDTALQQQVAFPHVHRFIALISAMPFLQDMVRFVDAVSHTQNKRLWPDYRRSDSSSFGEGLGSSDQQDMYLETPRIGPERMVLNPTLFYTGDVATKLSLKVLTEIFRQIGGHGSTLEMGDKGIFQTQSFEASLIARLQFVAAKWKGMDEADRIAWITDNFVRGKESYDRVHVACHNSNIG